MLQSTVEEIARKQYLYIYIYNGLLSGNNCRLEKIKHLVVSVKLSSTGSTK